MRGMKPQEHRSRNKDDERIAELRSMPGSDFAMEMARDFVFLTKPERARAVRMLTAINETIDRELNVTAAQ